jgi:hypothetical protein
MGLKLGRLPRKFHPKTLLFHKYALADAPPPPEKTYWEYKIPDDAWQMFGNDSIGDCTCACIAHMLMLVTAHTGTVVIPEESDVIAAYSAVSGYDPNTGANDNGAAITDVLNYWQTNGLAGHKILGWAEIDPTNAMHVNQAVYIFGGIDTGMNFPAEAMTQFNANQPWETGGDDTLDGGHSVPIFGYGSEGKTCVTWARRQQLSNDFYSSFFDEIYAVVTTDWLNNADGLAPNQLDLDALTADLEAIKA